jgi:hypothetical protein
VGHSEHGIVALRRWRIGREALEHRNMVRFTLHRQHRVDAMLRISANVTADFGIVTGLKVDAGLRGFDCRDGVGFVG